MGKNDLIGKYIRIYGNGYMYIDNVREVRNQLILDGVYINDQKELEEIQNGFSYMVKQEDFGDSIVFIDEVRFKYVFKEVNEKILMALKRQ